MGTGRDWHIDSALSEITVGYLQEIGMVAEAIAPAVSVKKQSDIYYVWAKGDFFRIPDTKLERKAQPKNIELSVSSGTYYAKGYGLGTELSYPDLSNADEPLELEITHSKLLVNIIYRDYENRIATLCTCGTNLGSYAQLSGTGVWTDKANSDPFGDVTSATNFIHKNTGFKPNIMVVGKDVHEALKQHPDIIDRIKYTARAGDAVISNALADLFGIEKYMVGEGVKNTGAENLANSFGYIWGSNVFLCHKPTAPGRMIPAFMYSFRWTPEGYPTAFTVEKKEDDDIKARKLRTYLFQDEKIVGNDLGFVINSVV